jgi:hypothetical protein
LSGDVIKSEKEPSYVSAEDIVLLAGATNILVFSGRFQAPPELGTFRSRICLLTAVDD